MSRFFKLLLISAFLCSPLTLAAQTVVNVTDADISAGQVVQWTSDNTYVLNGFVFVDDGAELWIEPGTVIKGKPGQGEQASALIVARGGKIYAEGTPTQPIIFTAEADDVTLSDDLPLDASGLWGGIIVLGKATLNSSPGETAIEGIPTTEPRGIYGGNDDADNSGVIRYVSIRYGGTDIGAGNEINGLTLGGVGSGTTVEYVEVFGNEDDGFEWFGGTVNTRYLVSAFNGDDAFDYDEGWRGKNQFWFVIQRADKGNRAGEHDGGTDPEDGTPYATPYILNATYIGSGASSSNASNDLVFTLRDNAGGHYINSVFTDFQNNGVKVEDLETGEDSRARLEAGQLSLKNNLWWGFGAGNDITNIATQDFVQTHLAANNNTIADPMLQGIARIDGGSIVGDAGGLDPRPGAGSPALSGAADVPDDPFFEQTDFLGAFGPGDLWIAGWTFISEAGVVKQTGQEVVNVTDANIAAGQTVQWTNDKIYILDGLVFVDDGAELWIEPGTVIKGKPGQGEQASALVVARGGKIYAMGTPTHPIIFTAEADDANDPNDLPLDVSGLWGGVIILGKATLNSSPGETAIEGIPTTEPRGIYGGNDDEDNSGVFRYVSIRYGGTDIGAGNEINGLTLGGVGSGTTIEFVEVFGNEDDGFEFFGGTVGTRYLVSAFNGDDAFDYDEGWRGKNQFWFVIQRDDKGNRAGEHDGGTDPEDGAPYATPYILNATYVGSGASSSNASNDLVFTFRDNAGGHYMNSVFTDFQANGVKVEDLESGEDSRARLEAGELSLSNNLWFGFGAGNDLANIATQDFVQAHLTANSNTIADPQLRGIGRLAESGQRVLDPRPGDGSPAWFGAGDAPEGFKSTDYVGAFGGVNWASDWTFISEAGVLSARGGGNPKASDAGMSTGVLEQQTGTTIPADFTLQQNYPNPFNPSTNISYALPRAGHVKLTVYNQLGQQVATLIDGVRQAGSYTVTWKASGFATGLYFYRLETAGQAVTKRMLLVK